MQVFGGIVQAGKQRGAASGFPTANIALLDTQLSGIYAGRVTFDGRTYDAAIYADQSRNLLESHLLDFSGDLYDKDISVEILEKIRDSVRFENEAALRSMIAEDIVRIREYLKNNH